MIIKLLSDYHLYFLISNYIIYLDDRFNFLCLHVSKNILWARCRYQNSKPEHLNENLQHKSQHEVSIMNWVLLQLKNMNGFFKNFTYIFMSLGSIFFLFYVNMSLSFSFTTIFAMMYLLETLVSRYIMFWKLSCFLNILGCM